MPDMPEIKMEYTKEDMQSLRKMWDEIFCDPELFTDYYFEEICKDNLILTAYYGDKLIGMVHLNPYNVYVYGIKKRCYYIVGVAVKQDMRGKGIMKSMLKKALGDMKEEGCLMTFLMPERREYYTGLGFQPIYRTNILEYDIKSMEEFADNYNNIISKNTNSLRLELLDKYDYNKLEKLAETINSLLVKRYKVFALRDAKYLKRMLNEHLCQDGNVCVVYDLDMNLEGVFSYDIYDSVMYVDRFELLGGNHRELLMRVLKNSSDKSCSKCIITMPDSVDKYEDEDTDKFPNLVNAAVSSVEGNGIMAYVFDNSQEISVNSLKNNSFFDEIA